MTSKPTPASELVKRFNEAIKKYGDYDVVVQLPNGRLCDDFDFSFWTVTLDKDKARDLKHKQYFVGSQTKLFKIKCK
jgi:hypothetical protein